MSYAKVQNLIIDAVPNFEDFSLYVVPNSSRWILTLNFSFRI
jgi:hypothetical protein